MATMHAQTTLTPFEDRVQQTTPTPPSPTLTNPDLILPDEPIQSPLSPSVQSDILSNSSIGDSPNSKRHSRTTSDGTGELLTATAVVMPQRLSTQSATILTSQKLGLYPVYEHGTPLSDIGEAEEESDGTSTTKGEDDSRPSSPEDGNKITGKTPRLRHKKRLSVISSSSGGSDIGTWDQFDTSKLASDRVAADIEHARESVDDDDIRSRRNSKEIDEELAALNDRAEKILANARKRLTHMEDNLSKARHSMMLSSSRSSPNMHEGGLGQQPAGGLYRSISQNAHYRKSARGGFPVKPNSIFSHHTRTGSDNVIPSGMKRLSRTPEVRSASALDCGRPRLGLVTPESKMYSHSPSSSRSFNSPLRILTEEGGSPSTVRTSPDSPDRSFGPYRGLGIHAAGVRAQEDLTQIGPEKSHTPNSLDRSNSQASSRSARELTERMSEMKSRIAELKSKAQADSMKRRSISSLRAESPFSNASPNVEETRYLASSPDQERSNVTTNHRGGPTVESRASARYGHSRKDSLLDEDPPVAPDPVTPVAARYLDVDDEPVGISSAKTDRNTPSLARRAVGIDYDDQEDGDADIESMVQPSNYENAERELNNDGDEDTMFANEEEQIYLNEVLEESLQELEPEIPAIPDEFVINEVVVEEGLSHEDRLDAFDYENMFLHSAMGTYTGSKESDDESDNESVETSRQTQHTPIQGDDDSDSDDSYEAQIQDENKVGADEVDTDEEMEAEMQSQSVSLPLVRVKSPLEEITGNTSKTSLQVPRKPWVKTARSNSMESTTSTATFQTATEGTDTPEDETPDEILSWGNAPVKHVTRVQEQQQEWPQPQQSPTRSITTNGHRRHPSSTSSSNSVRLANGNGYPHLRSASGSTIQNTSSRSSVNTLQRTASASGQYRIFPSPVPLQANNRTRSRNQSRDLDHEPEQQIPHASAFPSYIQHQHHHQSISQTQTQSDKQQRNLSNPPAYSQQQTQSYTHNSRLSVSTPSKLSSPTIPLSPNVPMSPSTPRSPSAPQPVKANTTILMESLIKLADPNFTLDPNVQFEEVDKELVLGLLGAVGGVCDGILRLQQDFRSQSRVQSNGFDDTTNGIGEDSYKSRKNMANIEAGIEELRERLEMSRDVLTEGFRVEEDDTETANGEDYA